MRPRWADMTTPPCPLSLPLSLPIARLFPANASGPAGLSGHRVRGLVSAPDPGPARGRGGGAGQSPFLKPGLPWSSGAGVAGEAPAPASRPDRAGTRRRPRGAVKRSGCRGSGGLAQRGRPSPVAFRFIYFMCSPCRVLPHRRCRLPPRPPGRTLLPPPGSSSPAIQVDEAGPRERQGCG